MFRLPATLIGITSTRRGASIKRLALLQELKHDLTKTYGLNKPFGFKLSIRMLAGESFLVITRHISEYVVVPVGTQFMVESLGQRELLTDAFRVAAYIVRTHQGRGW